jgi:signal transduction histidine kinase
MERLTRAGMLGELSTSLAHELNQPLAAILSNAQAARGFLRSPTADLAEVGGILEDIVRDDKRASGIIRRLRDMLRKGAVVQRERIDLNQVLQEMLGLLRRELEASPASLQLMLSATPPIVRGGRIELQQVLMNLLLNAIRAAQESPGGNQNIVLATECGATTAVVKVEDCGPGIPESSLSRIFEPFFSREAGGIGMGLSISRRIVEAHGGRIWAELRVGGGTRVAFELPLAGLEPHG